MALFVILRTKTAAPRGGCARVQRSVDADRTSWCESGSAHAERPEYFYPVLEYTGIKVPILDPKRVGRFMSLGVVTGVSASDVVVLPFVWQSTGTFHNDKLSLLSSESRTWKLDKTWNRSHHIFLGF